MARHLETALREQYTKLKVKVTKRAILLAFNEPLSGGEDPTVDIVVGLDRVGRPGLWIPNTETDRWDPSHPEEHTRLLTAEPEDLRLVRQHAIRLAKTENKRTEEPPLCSFNIEAFGSMFVERGMTDAEALLAIWRDGAADLSWRLTPDPAGVSAPIKVADLGEAVQRLGYAAAQLQSALDHDDDAEWVRRALAPLFPEFVPPTLGALSKAQVVAESRKPNSQLRFGVGGGLGVSGAAAVNTRCGLTATGPDMVAPRGTPRRPRNWLRPPAGPTRAGCPPRAPCPALPAPPAQVGAGGLLGGHGRGRPHPPPVSHDRVRAPLLHLPEVFADGPTDSPHRYADRGRTELCLWLPGDELERRWRVEDGLLALFGIATHHLFKEAWWRETGEWLGEEAPHDDDIRD